MQNNMKAVNRIINSVWTIEYKKISDNEIEIVKYSRDDADGYENEHQYQKGKLIENAERTVIGASIGGQRYIVTNQKHKFDYK